MRDMTTITVIAEPDFNESFPPENLLSFQAWLAGKIDEIPEEFRAKANIHISAETHHDFPHAKLEISYARPITEKERRARLSQEVYRKELQERQERVELQRLKSKYGET